jgi:hypothetical protein
MTTTAAINAICVVWIAGTTIDAIRSAPAADVIPEFSLTNRATVATRNNKAAPARRRSA